ncbi:MAG: ATP-dependent RecD-like DNA helicase [Acidimicrobiales bacterium]
MTTVNEQLRSADQAICGNITVLSDDRALLSQNLLAQLRNLVEAVAVRIHLGDGTSEFDYDVVGAAMAYVKSKANLNFLGRFHKLIQISASHYTLDGDASERLMLKYYEYLLRVRNLLLDSAGIELLKNLENFPVDLDPSLREYHEKISSKILSEGLRPNDEDHRERYYIHRVRPFFVEGRIYYEVTFFEARNNISKFDRIIAFTEIDIADNYSAMLTLQHDSIDVLGQTMPITIIRAWEVSIRPCELSNFARLVGQRVSVRSTSAEYRYLMQYLTSHGATLLDIVQLPDIVFDNMRSALAQSNQKLLILPALSRARDVILHNAPGANVLRYLLLRMNNQILKQQYDHRECGLLSGLNMPYGCKPFDTMPFCTSLPGHNPRFADLVGSIEVGSRIHELLARQVRINVEQRGILYTPIEDLASFGDAILLISQFNARLYYTHGRRTLEHDMGHVFIREYEDDTVTIIERLRERAALGIDGYTAAVSRWLGESPPAFDDSAKEAAMKNLFSESRVALIYGAAGTGKSTMVNYIASYFNTNSKLFLAQTHPALDNLKRRVGAQNATFRTIASEIWRSATEQEYDLLIIDECSTVSNSDLVKVLEKSSFKLLVLVGDVYQIESIQFGNWFAAIRSFIPDTSIFELTTPFRTKNEGLLQLWNKVRNIDDDVAEAISRGGYSRVLDKSLFEESRDDEIILCLNYDGLYGINNVNRFLQSSNPNPAIAWGPSTYKVGDPILFDGTNRFKPIIYNNLKGKIVGISRTAGKIQFDVELDTIITAFDVESVDLEWLGESVVRFIVHEYASSDDDDDAISTKVPFQVAYAVSIHKAQGLEYDSVKIVITDDNEEDISHSIFYTAITRARENLRIFWTPEIQHAITTRLQHKTNLKDLHILSNRRGLVLPSIR